MSPNFRDNDSYKKRVKFVTTKSPVLYKQQKHADSYANIVLHYLFKLKRIFQTNPVEDKSTRLNVSPRREEFVEITRGHSKRKAYDIVNAALQYGCANDIIEKVGDYFVVRKKSQSRVASRRPTPGPDFIRCASCKNLTKFDNKFKNFGMPKQKTRKKSRKYHEYGNCMTRKRGRSRPKLLYCPKCYARLKSSGKL